MRFLGFWLLLFALIAPFKGHADNECAVNYKKNSLGMCERIKCPRNPGIRCAPGQVVNDTLCPARCTPRCPEKFYYDPSVKLCAPICPNGGALGISDRGDLACKLPRALSETEKYAYRCAEMGKRYVPQTGVCSGSAPKKKITEEVDQCPAGQVAVRVGNKYGCKKGDPQAVVDEANKVLEKQGLSYLDFLQRMSGAQTSISDLRILELRIQEAKAQAEFAKQNNGVLPVEETKKPAGSCPQGYVPNNDGKGCKPEKDCTMYRCPNGSVPSLQKSGDTYYCGC